jgi:hypothetical protein
MDQTSALTTTPSRDVFSSIQAFEDGQRIGKCLCSSDIVPQQYQGQKGLGNTMVAMEMAYRMGLSPLQVMQNLHIIHGRPSWSSQFIIALINGCGRFEPLRYEMTGKGDDLACYAMAKEKATGNDLVGPTITMAMAKAEGWASKSGSKWKTMPELMIRYRAAAFWGRLFVPELLCGITHTQEEAIDIQEVSVSAVSDLNAKVAEQPKPEPVEDEIF